MTSTTIKAGTYGPGRKLLSYALSNLIPFKTSGSLAGHAEWYNPGRLTGEDLERFNRDYCTGFSYIVTSYATPIAWVTNTGEVYRVGQKFSVTTSKHQGTLWQLGLDVNN